MKPSTMTLLIQARREIVRLKAEVELMKAFTIQQCEDMAIITLNQDFGFGPKRAPVFRRKFRETFLSYAAACVEDGTVDKEAGTGDPEIAYTKTKLDEALRRACGDDMLPFDQRYEPSGLYYREKAEEALKDEKA